VQTVERHQVQTERIDTNMDCPKCGKRGVRYSEVQQRSADEGSTIIYNCDCGERCVILAFTYGRLLTFGHLDGLRTTKHPVSVVEMALIYSKPDLAIYTLRPCAARIF
jgi:hypothetical protein